MPDTETTVVIQSGDNHALNSLWMANTNGSVAAQTIPRVGGAVVGPANPMPVSKPAVGSVFSTTYEGSHVIKAAPGTLYGIQMNAQQSGWLLLFDATTVPVDGAVVPRKAYQYSDAVSNTLLIHFDPPLAMQVGVVVVFSSSGPFAKAQIEAAQFSCEVA